MVGCGVEDPLDLDQNRPNYAQAQRYVLALDSIGTRWNRYARKAGQSGRVNEAYINIRVLKRVWLSAFFLIEVNISLSEQL